MASIRFWTIARRPRWIAALLLCLGVAAGFAALGQWQLSRSVDNATVAQGPDTDAQNQPAAADLVESPVAFGDLQRVVVAQHENRGGQPDPRRAPGDESQQPSQNTAAVR